MVVANLLRGDLGCTGLLVLVVVLQTLVPEIFLLLRPLLDNLAATNVLVVLHQHRHDLHVFQLVHLLGVELQAAVLATQAEQLLTLLGQNRLTSVLGTVILLVILAEITVAQDASVSEHHLTRRCDGHAALNDVAVLVELHVLHVFVGRREIVKVLELLAVNAVLVAQLAVRLTHHVILTGLSGHK